MRQAAMERRQAGDKLMFVVEGLELFGEPDKALFHDSQHPNDAGNELMAERLAPIIERVLLPGKGVRVSGPGSGTNAAPARLP
jgi:lysophospholipase L1-like esterase